MAKRDTTAGLELDVSEDSVAMNKRRRDIAFEAVAEIDKLASVLRGSVPLDDNNTFYAVRGITARMQQLSSVIMSALDDEAEDTPHLWAEVNIKHESEFA